MDSEDPTCARALISMSGDVCPGGAPTMPVCSKPAGNTEQGLCDMTGSVAEYVQDVYASSYEGAPTNGQAREEGGVPGARVIRGGGWSTAGHNDLRVARRQSIDSLDGRRADVGFRLVISDGPQAEGEPVSSR